MELLHAQQAVPRISMLPLITLANYVICSAQPVLVVAQLVSPVTWSIHSHRSISTTIRVFKCVPKGSSLTILTQQTGSALPVM